jgi:hypothetical protein
MQAGIPHYGFYVINVDDLRGSFVQFVDVRGRNCGGSSFWILYNGGITDQRRHLNINPIRVHMSMEP